MGRTVLDITANAERPYLSKSKVSNEFATNVVARIASGSYDVHFKKQNR